LFGGDLKEVKKVLLKVNPLVTLNSYMYLLSLLQRHSKTFPLEKMTTMRQHRPQILRKLVGTFTLLLLSIYSYSGNIEGVVHDESGFPVISANVYIDQGRVHTHTDELGYFIITNVDIGDTLHISNIGYQSISRSIVAEDLQHPLEIKLLETSYGLDQVVISSNTNTQGQLLELDLKVNPVTNSQEILQRVPGLVIGQHAGGGKAEQLFLRGFDLDHGTDINISVDGMPVNMVSHAHGQGYADLHYLIPEVVDRIDYGKGPYQTTVGNFATAGQVAFHTKERLEGSSIGLEYGRYNTLRMLGLLDLFGEKGPSSGYIAFENLQSDGPFEASQDFQRINLLVKYGYTTPIGDKISLTASHFNSSWNASGQIPTRAVDLGLITRFGSIDDTEGGFTGRTNYSVAYTKNLGNRTLVKSQAYFIDYDFELYSNFTFFLNDPINGDEIKQREERNIIGFKTKILKEGFFSHHYFSLEGGIDLRRDKVDELELSHTIGRSTQLESIYLGNILETNAGVFVDGTINFGHLTINPGLRLDHFKFDYQDQLAQRYSYVSKTAQQVSPKLAFFYSPNNRWQHFLKLGKGFHSNDTRSVTSQELGQLSPGKILPSAYGIDIGSTWSPVSRLFFSSTLWYLHSDQEFIYVGDEGIVEPSGMTKRMGIEVGLRTQLTKALFLFGDYNYAKPRSIEEERGQDRVPLAPIHTASAGVVYRGSTGLSAGMRFIYLGDRPATETYSLTADGYFKVDLNVQYDFKRFSIGGAVQNLLNAKWNETQFATESRLQGETESVEEIHFTPGIPFAPRLKLSYRF
jgi:hypothetical protein